MTRAVVTGLSDDLIEVDWGEGDTEFVSFYNHPTFVVFPTGDALRVSYINGVWVIEKHGPASGKLSVEITKCGDEEGAYTDKAVVEGDFDPDQIDIWDVWPPTAKAIDEKVYAYLDANGIEDDEKLYKLFEVLYQHPVPGTPPTVSHPVVTSSLKELARSAFEIAKSKGFWDSSEDRWNGLVIPAQLALIHSEVSEALESWREVMDAHSERQRSHFAFELADVVIRTIQLSHALGIDIQRFVELKMEQNRQRPFKHGKRL